METIVGLDEITDTKTVNITLKSNDGQEVTINKAYATTHSQVIVNSLEGEQNATEIPLLISSK